MAEAAPEPRKPDPGGYAMLDAKVERVRETAKWLVGAFAAVAVLLIPGLKVSDIGALDGWRLVVALAAALVGILASALAAILAATFLRPVEPTLSDLIEHEAKDDDALGRYLRDNRFLLRRQAKDLGALRDAYVAARRTANRAGQDADDAARTLDRALAEKRPAAQIEAAQAHRDRAKQAFETARARCTILEQIINQVQAVSRFQGTREDFRGRRWEIAGLALVAAGAIAAFAIATHPPDPGHADFSGATLDSLDLSGTNLEEADFDGATLVNVDLRDANLERASFDHARLRGVDLRSADLEDADIEDAVFKVSTCPDGVRTASTVSTCSGHIFVPPDLDITWRRPLRGGVDARG